MSAAAVVAIIIACASCLIGVKAWAPARGEQGGQAPTLETIRVAVAHPGNFSRGLTWTA